MQRWQGAALGVALCSGCLDPLVDDAPGYSRYVLPPSAPVASAYDDLQLARKIDMNDGLTGAVVPMKNAFVAGAPVKYWDLGAAKRSANAAYVLTHCADGRPVAEPRVDHPMVIETLPGDSDYSPFRSIQWTCVTPSYRGELFTSSDAISDGIDLGLLNEPLAADRWRNWPVVNRGIQLALSSGNRPPRTAFYKGKTVNYQQFEDQEGDFGNPTMLPAPGYVFEITKLGFTAVVKTVFSQPYRLTDGTRNPAYSPQWIVTSVTLRSVTNVTESAEQDAEVAGWTRDTDFVVYNAMGVPTPRPDTAVLAVIPSTNRVNRPHVVNAEVAP